MIFDAAIYLNITERSSSCVGVVFKKFYDPVARTHVSYTCKKKALKFFLVAATIYFRFSIIVFVCIEEICVLFFLYNDVCVACQYICIFCTVNSHAKIHFHHLNLAIFLN